MPFVLARSQSTMFLLCSLSAFTLQCDGMLRICLVKWFPVLSCEQIPSINGHFVFCIAKYKCKYFHSHELTERTVTVSLQSDSYDERRRISYATIFIALEATSSTVAFEMQKCPSHMDAGRCPGACRTRFICQSVSVCLLVNHP